MPNTIYLDMDGTFVDLYGFDGWLGYLIKEDTRPYVNAKPLINLSLLARYLNKAQNRGYRIGIISWTSKNGSRTYNEAVAIAKRLWLAYHLPSVQWDEIHIIDYGTPKSTCRKGADILFDDEEKNLNEWGIGAITASKMLETLKNL